jgi:DNA-binding MarR family transcriptional regulator
MKPARSRRTAATSRKRARPAQVVDESYRARLDRAKSASTIQLLFRAARLIDEEALQRVAEKSGGPRLRRSHTSLFPHIDLEGTRVTDLADRLGVTKQAVSQLVDDLEAIDVLERVADPDDARARRVRFTSRGRAGLLEGLVVLGALEDEYAAKIGKRCMKELHRALVSLLAQVEGPAPKARP